MNDREARQQFDKGVLAARNSHFYLAQTCFARAAELAPSPETDSWIAYCHGAARQEFDPAIATLRAAVAQQPDNPLHQLLLGRLLLLAGRRGEALEILRQGSHLDSSGEFLQVLEEFGSRKPPVFPSLARTNPINRICGLILSRLELR